MRFLKELVEEAARAFSSRVNERPVYDDKTITPETNKQIVIENNEPIVITDETIELGIKDKPIAIDNDKCTKLNTHTHYTRFYCCIILCFILITT